MDAPSGAGVHDNQVAIPLARMTAQRITLLYDLIDSRLKERSDGRCDLCAAVLRNASAPVRGGLATRAPNPEAAGTARRGALENS